MKTLVVLFLMFMFPMYAVLTSKELYIAYRIAEQTSPDKIPQSRSRSRSFPGHDIVFDLPDVLKIPPHIVPKNTPKDLSLDEISIDIPKEKETTVVDQIEELRKADAQSKLGCCTPSKAVIAVAIVGGLTGIITGALTAAVTLIVHFTTK